MARYFTNFTEEPYGEINDLSKNWVRIGGPGTRSNQILNTSPGGRKLSILGGPMPGPSLVGFKPSQNFNYANTIESLVQFSVDTPTQVPGSFGIVNHNYNGTQGLSLAFLPASNVKSLILYDDKNGITVNFVNYNWSVATKYWVRYRQENTTHYVKIWQDGSAEPGSWTMTSTYDIGAISGTTYAGVGTYTENGDVHYYKYALATNGDTAIAEYTGAGTYYNGYANRKKLTIDRTKVGSFSGFFQTLILHTDPDLRTVANGGKVKKNPLLDIRFEDKYGVKLPHEVVSYDPTTGAIEAWVRLDSLSTAVDTELYIYFGKDLTVSTYRGIQLGYGDATQMVIERNWDRYANTENQGEASVFISGLKNPQMVSVADPNDRVLVGQEEAGKSLVTGFMMYSVELLSTRFGMSTGWNDHVILVYHDGSTWRYDNNSSYVAFTPVSTDFLIAEASWGQPVSTGRAFNYIGPRPAGEEKPWIVWSDLTDESQDIGVVANNYRNVLHMNGIPDVDSSTFEQSDRNRFGMNFGSFGSMNAGDVVNSKVGKGLYFDGANHLLRAKKDVIWTASSVGFFSMWFKTDSVTDTDCLYSQRTGVGTGTSLNLFLISGALRVDFGSSSLWSTGWTASANTWYHLAVQTDGSTRRLFINGVQVATQSSTVAWPTSTDYYHVQIGASITNATASNNFFDGIIDEFRMYAAPRENGYFLTDYNNQNSPSTFYSVGALEQAIVVNTITQTGNARIRRTEAATTTGNARIQRTENTTQQGNARIRRTESAVQQGNARIQRTASTTQTGNARLERVESISQIGNATLESFFFVTSIDQTGNARIERMLTTTQQGDARIERVRSTDQVGSAHIERVESISQTGNATLYRIDRLDQVGNATIEKDKTINQIGSATIIRQDSLQQIGDARIERTESIIQLGNAAIIRIDQLTQVGNARIERVVSTIIIGNAQITNPTPDKRPQEWEDASTDQPAEWNAEDRAEQMWDSTEDKPETPWQNSQETQEQQWSDGDNKQPAEWRRQFYD